MGLAIMACKNYEFEYEYEESFKDIGYTWADISVLRMVW